MGLIFVLLLSLLPALAIALLIYFRDVHEREPIKMLALGFVFGILSFGISIGAGYALSMITDLDQGDLMHQLIRAFIFVGFIEELSKYAFLRGVLFRSKYFDEPFDGIVYAVMIGMGFVTAENFIYIMRGGSDTAFVRMFTAVPAHAVFAVIMGFFLGEAKVFPTSRGLYGTLGLLAATFVHGFYDYFLFISFIPGLWVQAFISLAIAIGLSYFAIRRHQQDSPHHEEPDD